MPNRDALPGCVGGLNLETAFWGLFPVAHNRPTAEWIVELPDSLMPPDFLLPKVINGSGSAGNGVIFENCAAALAADPGLPVLAAANLTVSRRINMIRPRPNESTVETIAKTVSVGATPP